MDYSGTKPPKGTSPGPRDHGKRWGASYATQFWLLSARSLKTRRFEALGLQRFLQLFLVGLLTGLFWWQQGQVTSGAGGTRTSGDVQNTVGLLFFEMLFMSFASLFAALFTFPAEYRMLLKERASGMYRLSAFYLARMISDLPLDCLYPSIFVFLLYWMGGLRADALAFLGNWLAVLLTVLVGQSLGLLLGTAVMNPKVAQTFATVLMLTFMLTAGFYVDDIPVWIGWMKYLGFTYYTWRILVKIQFGYSSLAKTEWPAGLTTPDEINLGLDFGILLVFLIGLRLANYAVLRHKTKLV